MNENLRFVTRIGNNIDELFDDLAKLRITVFHDFPYLYEGSIAYEKEYLKTYSQSTRSFLFAVYDGESMVGATTAIPLTDETTDVQMPFVQNGIRLEDVFYFGESILLKSYRGLGIGHRFFDTREAHAASYGSYRITSFCSVERPTNHPLKPADYRTNDVFWLKRGYVPHPELVSNFEWTDLGEKGAYPKKDGLLD